MARCGKKRSLDDIIEDKSQEGEMINFGRRAIKVSEEKKTVLPVVHGYNPRPAKIRKAHQPKQAPPVKVIDDVKVVAHRAATRTTAVIHRQKQVVSVEKPVDLVEDILALMKMPEEEAKKRKAEIEKQKRAAQLKRRREAVNPAARILYEIPLELLEFEREIGWA